MTVKLPSEREVKQLEALVVSFPASGKDLQQIAAGARLSPALQEFVAGFAANELFMNHDDLVIRLEELRLFIAEEQDSPKEHLRSPQD